MPNIDSIPVELYQPLDAYNHIVDNKPLNPILERIDVVNDAVDLLDLDIDASIGTQGSLSNRLNQSINQDGSLKVSAIDDAFHSIAEHEDTADFVRMTAEERAKLVLISSEATSLNILVETDNAGDVTFSDTTLTLEASDTVIWNYDGSKLSAAIDFPTTVRHVHYYNTVPYTTNYKNYTTSILNTAYREGSLRVYINGIRLNSTNTVAVPFSTSGSISWVNLKFTEGTATSSVVTGGDFVLNTTIASSSSVIIDFDVIYS